MPVVSLGQSDIDSRIKAIAQEVQLEPMKTSDRKNRARIAFVKPLEVNYLYETTSTDLVDLLEFSNCHTGPLAFFTDYDTDIYLTNLPSAPECQSWEEGLYMGTGSNARRIIRQRKARARQRSQELPMSSVERIKWSDYQAVISIGCAIPWRIVRQHPATVWCYYVPDPSPVFFLSKKWGPLHGYNVFFTQGISPHPPTTESIQAYQETHRIVLDVPFVFMRPDTFTQLFPANERRGIGIESRSAQGSDAQIVERLSAFGSITCRVPSVRDYVKQLASTRYFIVLDTPHERFRGNALVEANAAGCLIVAPEVLRSLNEHLIPKPNRYRGYDNLLKLLHRLDGSEDLRSEWLGLQSERIARMSYANPKDAFDRILQAHAQSVAPVVTKRLTHRYLPITCTKVMPFLGAVNTVTSVLTGKTISTFLAETLNRKGKMF